MSELVIKSIAPEMRKPLLVASMSVILLAGLELIGWICGWQRFTVEFLRYIPMAPSTAICFIVLSLNGLFESRKESARVHLVGSISVILLVMVYCGLNLLQYWGQLALNIEDLLFPNPEYLNGAPLARMSPLTGGLFLLSGGALLLGLIRSTSDNEHDFLGNLSGLLGSVVAFAGFTILLGYVYGTPFLYGSGMVPVAATTAAAFLFLGFAVVTRLRPDDIPLCYFLGPPIQRRLVRMFTPPVFFAVLLQGAVSRFTPLFVDVNNALLSALLVAAIAILVVIAVSKTASMAGNDIDQAERGLRLSEERYRRLFEHAPLMYVITRNEQDVPFISDCNELFLSSVGHTREAVVGQPLADFFSPESRAELLEHGDYARALAGEFFIGERQLLTRDRRLIPTLLYTATEVDRSGHVTGTRAMFVDITERRRAEEELRASEVRYRAVFDNAGIGIDLLDRDGRILQVNQTLLDMLGYSEEELHQLTFLDVTHPEEREISKRNLEALMAGEIEFYRLEKRYLRKDRSILWADLTTSAIRGPNGEHSGTIGVISDITDRKKAEQEREQLRNQLAQVQKMESIGTLTGGIAHDFNNLLTIMNGYAELILSEKTEDDPSYSDLQMVLETGRKGAEMVQRLLAFSKKAEISLSPLDLNGIVENAIDLVRRTFPKMIEIETILAKDLSMVNADAVQVEQVLMNLCINAKEAMPEGGLLKVETRNTTVNEDYCRLNSAAKPGLFVLIEVTDSGSGISAETRDRMFDPFFTTKGWDFNKGTGLGLSVAKGIVEQHGGWITCQSEPGTGTTFTVFLPIIKDSPLFRKPETLPEATSGGEKILLVDDEEYVRDLGRRILERSGYNVFTASNGREALEIYARERSNIGLIVLDLIMPHMGGEKCLEEFLKINPRARVIVSTGRSLDPKERDHLEAYAKGFVNKPYQMQQFMEVVREVLAAP